MASVRGSVVPALSARRPAAWIDGPSAIGSVNGMPISIRSAPAAGSRRSRRVAAIGIAGVRKVTSAAAALALQFGEARGDAAHSLRRPSCLATVKMSLSPRPDKLITMRCSGGSRRRELGHMRPARARVRARG